ncbi:MAG: acetyltransferase [Nanoarchaeota archaeon]|nr:acetyltransferase [Nanoarchaeota archaeon]
MFTKKNIGNYTLINKYVKLGKNSKIWHFCNIYGTAENPVIIGDNVQIGSYTEIKPDVKIGNDCRFQSYIFIPDGVEIGNMVFIGPNVVFTNDKYPSAIKTINKTWKMEKTIIGDNVTIGARTIIGPGIKIGNFSFIGMGSVITKDVPEKAIVVGNPAKIIGYVENKKYKNILK